MTDFKVGDLVEYEVVWTSGPRWDFLIEIVGLRAYSKSVK